MTVHKPKDRATYRYKFVIDGKVYQGSTGQITKADAEEFELEEKRRVRRALAGLAPLTDESPYFDVWAEIYVKHLRARGKVRRIDRVEDLLRVVLRFWGRRPKKGAVEGEPYHGLRLADPIRDPEWIERFEDWIAHRKVRIGTDEDGDPIYRPVGKQQRLHYMSIMSRMYRVARLPRFRKKTGVSVNPFLEIERDKPPGRTVTVTPAELRAWLRETPKHAQLAIAIAALAPKLRLQNVLGLRWDRSFDPALQFITVEEHKTVGITGKPMVVPISRPLRRLLKAVRAARDERTREQAVVTYRGRSVKSIRDAVRSGAIAAGLTYGRDVVGGVTFHTIRHTAATLLAEVPSLTEAQRSATMGQDIETTQLYTHLRPVSQRPVVNRLAERLNLGHVLEEAFGRPESGAESRLRSSAKKSEQKRAKRVKARSGRKTRSHQ